MFSEYLISTLTMITLGMNELNSLPLGCINLHTSSCSRSDSQVAVNHVAGAKGNKRIYLHVMTCKGLDFIFSKANMQNVGF